MRFTEQPKGTQYMEKFQNLHKDFFAVPDTCFMTSGIIGGIKVTVPCITSRNSSKMLSKNINELLTNKVKLQLLLLRVVQQGTRLPYSETLRTKLRRFSVFSSNDYCPQLLQSQLRHSKFSDNICFKKLQQRRCGETLAIKR